MSLGDTDRAKHFLMTVRGLSARDALHAAVAHNRGVPSIASFDREFDRVS